MICIQFSILKYEANEGVISLEDGKEEWKYELKGEELEITINYDGSGKIIIMAEKQE